MSLYAYAMFLFYVWNSFIALLNLFVIAIITLRSEIKVTLPFSGICGSAYRKFVWVELIIKITVDMNNIFMKLYVT
jgi:hypothetical protein